MPPEKSTIIVRVATEADVAVLARLVSAFDDESLTPAQMAARMKAAQPVETPFLAGKAGEESGLACLRITPGLSAQSPHAEVTELFVLKKGQPDQLEAIERSLLERVEAHARQCGATSLVLFTGPKNLAAQSRYHMLGYQDYSLALRKRLVDGANGE